jgi:hypothetical protein
MDAAKTTWKPVPLAMDDDLKREVELASKDLNQKQATVMRDAIRKGLPLVKSGGEVISLDGPLSEEVTRVQNTTGMTRVKVLLEAVRAGLPMVENVGPRNMFEEAEAGLSKIERDLRAMTEGEFAKTAHQQFAELRAYATSQARRLQEVEREVARLKKALVLSPEDFTAPTTLPPLATAPANKPTKKKVHK